MLQLTVNVVSVCHFQDVVKTLSMVDQWRLMRFHRWSETTKAQKCRYVSVGVSGRTWLSGNVE